MDAAIRRQVVAALTDVAPEVDPATLKDAAPLRDQVDLDSMDWLRFLTGLEKQLGVTVSESDYASLVTLADVVGYVERRKP